MSTPGNRDLIRLGVIVVAGTALGVGAVSQWKPAPDIAWGEGPTINLCTQKVSPWFYDVGVLKNSTSKNIDIIAVKTNGSSAGLHAGRFYVVPPDHTGLNAADPAPSAAGDNHALVPSSKYQQLEVYLSNNHINGHATQLQITFKNAGETSTHTYPVDVTIGGLGYNPACNH